MDTLLEQLEKLRTKLKAHKPPHVTPPDVEKQIKELVVIVIAPSSLLET